ncbi:metal ABC transporter permease [Bartonella ancashensis]|uniref:metal ABC transporter permease n=1 Tax=Bartonella ancashensis TaxID=1318743 RepID=UPI0039E655C8
MISLLLEPLSYQYMVNAIWVSGLVGCVCAFLSAFLMLKGWSLIGDALSHSIVPGIAGAYLLGLPFSLGAFFSGGLAAAAMLFFHHRTKLKEDTIIGLIFSSFFALGLFLKSLKPMAVSIDTIVLGNVLAISSSDIVQLACIGFVSLFILLLKWKDLLVSLFDENHARAIGLNVQFTKILFFTLLAACTIAAMQTVGAFLVICLVVTPGATAYLLSDRFVNLLIIAVLIGTLTSMFGVYVSYFLNAQTGGVVVLFQALLFVIAFIFAPKHGFIAARLRVRKAKKDAVIS